MDTILGGIMFEIVKEYYDSLWDNKTNNAMNVGSLVVIYDNDDTRKDELC